MQDFFQPFLTLQHFTTRDLVINVVDILLVTYLIYRGLMLVRGTRAWRIILGVIGFLIVLYLSGKWGLTTLHWLLEKATYLGPVALVVLLLPELRTVIEGFGRPATLLPKIVTTTSDSRAEARTIEELVAAVAELAADHVGALIVIEGESPMMEIAGNGVMLQARVSAALLRSIFYEGNPLHDGAVLIHGDTIVAASCRLPLSESQRPDHQAHTRHDAGVGASELFDCLVIIVSEERGTISVAREGRLTLVATPLELRRLLNRELRDIEEGRETPEPRSRRAIRRRSVQTNGRDGHRSLVADTPSPTRAGSAPLEP